MQHIMQSIASSTLIKRVGKAIRTNQAQHIHKNMHAGLVITPPIRMATK